MLTTEPTVLVLGEPDDPHIQSVVKHLTDLGRRSVILDVWEAWSPVTLSLEDGLTVSNADGKWLRVQSVWMRLKPRLGSGFTESEAFALRERREFLYGLSEAAGTGNWINHPCKQECARNKITQLRMASEVGLVIPKTWVSNDASAVSRHAIRFGGQLVYKPLTWLATLKGEILYTNAVGADSIVKNAAAIRCAPGIFQEVVSKACEYRVTVIDADVFTVRIHSQDRRDTSLDWRRNQDDVRYETCNLDGTTTQRLQEFLKRLQVRYAAFDLIETPSGEIVFLEANLAGNWLWLEERLHLPISLAIARALVNDLRD